MNFISIELTNIFLNLNKDKTKVMHISASKQKITPITRSFQINCHPVECVNSIKYLGFLIVNNMNLTADINRVKQKFYIEFNSILRKFSYSDNKVKLYLFKQYCLQFYGSELWFGCSRSSQPINQFAIGYHKAIKKLLGLSSHESNHYACQEANVLMFNHFINKIKIRSSLRFLTKPCSFIGKIMCFYMLSSVMYREVKQMLLECYQIDSLLENDYEAIMSRISFVQNHENQMRVSW